MTGDNRPGAIVEARSYDDLRNTRARPASSRALCDSVQAEIIDNREGKQRQRKPVECRFPFFLEKFVGAHLFALSPTSVIDDRGGGLSGLGAPECDRACDGSGPAPHGVPVIVRTACPSLPL